MPQSSKKPSTIQKGRTTLGIGRVGRKLKSGIGAGIRRIEDEIKDLAIDAEHIGTMLQNRGLRRQASSLPKNAKNYEMEILDTVDDAYKRRLKGKYGPIGQKIKSLARPFVGVGGATLTNNTLSSQQNTKKRLKKGLVNPTLHEIRQANPTRTRQPIKYGTSTYAQSVAGMAGSGRNRNSDKLRQLMEDASTLSTGGRPNPEHNAKRFYGLFGQSAINEPQKSMSKLQLQQRQIKQDLREGHANRRMAKSSSLKKGSYGNVFVSGAAVDPMMIVQPKKGRRFKGQTMGMTLVSKSAKTLRKDSTKDKEDKNSGSWQWSNDAISNWLHTTGSALAGTLGARQLQRELSSKNKNESKTPKVTASSTASYEPSSPYATTKIPTTTSTTSTMGMDTIPQKSFKEKWNDFKKNPMKPFADMERNAYNAGVRGYQQAKQEYDDARRNVANFVQDAKSNANVKTFMKPFADMERNAYYAITEAPQNIKNTIVNTGTEIAQAPGIQGKIGVVGGKLWNAGSDIFRRASLPQTAIDIGILGYGLGGRVLSSANDKIQNKVNVNAVPDSTYQRPVKVGEERYDVRPRSENRDTQSDDAYFASDILRSKFGPSTYESGDSKEYEALALEQLPRRLQQEQGRFGRPVVRTVRSNSASALMEDAMNAMNVKDITTVGAFFTPYATNYAMADFGTPFAGGHTNFRTPLSGAIGRYPVETTTGWAMESSRDGQKSYSAPGALKLYRENLKNISDDVSRSMGEVEEVLKKDPNNEEALFYKDYFTSILNQTQSTSEALRQIDSRVSSWDDLQNEIDIARKNNNEDVVNLLTKPTKFFLPSPKTFERNPQAEGMYTSGAYILPSIESLAGYQMPLRNVTIARVGDKYGENLMPYQLRGRQSTVPSQALGYVPEEIMAQNRYNNAGPQSISYPSMMTDEDYEPQLSDFAYGFAGYDPAGVRTVPNYDDDWLIGAQISNYPTNRQPIRINDVEPVLDKDGDPVLDMNGYPINASSQNIKTELVLDKNGTPVLDKNGNPVTRQYFQSGIGPRLSSAINPATGKYVPYRRFLPSARGKVEDSLASPPYRNDAGQNLWYRLLDEMNALSNADSEYEDVEKRSKSQAKTSRSSTKKSSVKKSSLTPSSLMPPMGSASPAKMPKASSAVTPTRMPQPSTNVGSTFVKSLNQNPKPIEPMHAKHKNKYFK